MNNSKPDDTAPSDSGAIPTPSSESKDALSALDRLITPEDLDHRGAQKLILDRLDRAEKEYKKLEPLRDLYANSQTELAVALQQLDAANEVHGLRTVMNGIGCAFLGFIPAAAPNWGLAALMGIAGVVMIGAAAKFAKIKNTK